MTSIAEIVKKVPSRSKEHWSSYLQNAKTIFLKNQFIYTAYEMWEFFSLVMVRECGDENCFPLLNDYLKEMYPEIFGKLRYMFDLEFRVREQKKLLHEVLMGQKDRVVFYCHVRTYGELLGTYGPDDYYHISDDDIKKYSANEEKRFKELEGLPELSISKQDAMLKSWGIK